MNEFTTTSPTLSMHACEGGWHTWADDLIVASTAFQVYSFVFITERLVIVVMLDNVCDMCKEMLLIIE